MGEVKGVKLGGSSSAAAKTDSDGERVNLAMRAPSGGVTSTLPPAGDPLATQGTSSALKCGLALPEKNTVRPLQSVGIDIQDRCQVDTLIERYGENADDVFGVWAEGASVFWDIHVSLEMHGIPSTDERYVGAFRTAFRQRVTGGHREEHNAKWVAYREGNDRKGDLDPRFIREVVPQLVQAMDKINEQYLLAAQDKYGVTLEAASQRRLVAQMAFAPKEGPSADSRDAWDGFAFPRDFKKDTLTQIDNDLCKLRGHVICGWPQIALGGLAQTKRDMAVAIIFGDILRQKGFPPKSVPVEL